MMRISFLFGPWMLLFSARSFAAFGCVIVLHCLSVGNQKAVGAWDGMSQLAGRAIPSKFVPTGLTSHAASLALLCHVGTVRLCAIRAKETRPLPSATLQGRPGTIAAWKRGQSVLGA